MSILILGATSPIARALAERYAEEGHPIALAARAKGEAERIAKDLAIRHGVETLALAFDALAYDTHAAVVDQTVSALGPIDVALIAFGDMGDQEDSEHSFEAARHIIDVNYTGAVSVCEALAKTMSARERGCIVGIASVAGDRGRKSNYFYGSAKGAFALYLQGLRNRLFASNVHVVTVKPGFVDTRMTFGMETKIPIAAPDDVAKAIVHAVEYRSNVLYFPHFWAGIMGVIKAIPEELFKRLSL